MSVFGIDDFLWRALAGGLGVALAAGPLGSFVVWRRMAYFGDTLAHAGLLGVVLGVLAGIGAGVGVLLTGVALALLLLVLQGQRRLPGDTVLGILAHTALSLGLVAAAFLDRVRIDLNAWLFGDILAIAPMELVWIWAGGALALGVLAWIWRPLLAMTVHEELARVEGVPVETVRLVFLLLIALVVAVAMKVVGALLITSLLIIPPAAARRWARSPEGMAAGASLIGALAVGGGLAASLVWDTPAGPSVVVCAALLFVPGVLLPGRS